jgi:O-antigen ligase/Tfp pilus assembly protein PilF
MGLLTRLCFVICFLGLIAGIGVSEGRLLKALWVMVISGGLVAAYAMAQFFGLDPFAPASVYTFPTDVGDVIRVCSSIGHSNYLGNFLLYTTPLSAGLALATEKRERLLAAIVTAMSLLAIVLSVARGAWVGIIAGTIFFVVLELKYAPSRRMNRKNLLRYAAMILLLSGVAISIVAFSPASRSIKERVQALLTQGVASSGRLVLWRDSLKMLPAYALTGAGAEGFRKAHLVYKSKELAKLAQPDNNESSHNSYLDAAISHGLPGFALYLAILISTLRILMRARRRAATQNWRMIISGITASFVAVLTHNFFIFDQLSTGLYFFAFLALASALSNVFGVNAAGDQTAHSPQPSQADEKDGKRPAKSGSAPDKANPYGLWAHRAATAFSAFAVILAVWYSAGLIEAELAFKKIFDPTIARNFQAITKRCEEVANSPLPTGAYYLMVAKALDTYSQSLLSFANSGGQPSPEANNLLSLRSSALQLGIGYAEKSLAHNNTPDINYNTLGALSLAAGDKERLKFAASQAVKSDPNNFYSRWLLAEAYLANGEREAAASEAALSLELAPKFTNASSALQRAQGQARGTTETAKKRLQSQTLRYPNAKGRSIEEVIAYARQLSEQGNLHKAKRKLLTALVRSPDDCLDCHRELARVYEKLGLYAEAIRHWESVARQTTESASVGQISTHLESLKLKNLTTPK